MGLNVEIVWRTVGVSNEIREVFNKLLEVSNEPKLKPPRDIQYLLAVLVLMK